MTTERDFVGISFFFFLGVFLNGGIIGGFANAYMFGSTLGIYEKSVDIWIPLPLE